MNYEEAMRILEKLRKDNDKNIALLID